MSSLVATIGTTGVQVDQSFPEGAIRVDFVLNGTVVQSGPLDPNGAATLSDPAPGDYTAQAIYVDGTGAEFGNKITSSTVNVPTGGGDQKTIQVPGTIDLVFNP